MSPEEKRWSNRLKRLLKSMPKGLELQVHYGFVQINEAGARDRYFESHGDADNVPHLDQISVDRVYPCSESV